MQSAGYVFMEGGGSFYILPGEGGGEESKGERGTICGCGVSCRIPDC